MIGFIDLHPFVAKRLDSQAVAARSEQDIRRIGEIFGGIGARFGQRLETCATEVALEEFGIAHGACIEREQIEKICGYRLEKVREKYLRPHCNCLETIDIGHYSTCGNGCVYCYATLGRVRLDLDPLSPSLDPAFDPTSPIVDAACRSFRPRQGVLF